MGRGVAAGVGLALAMAACASHATPPTQSPEQLLAAGVQSLMALQSVQVSGSFTVDGSTGSVQASILRNASVSGVLNLDEADSPFIAIGGYTYYETLAPFVVAGFPSLEALAASLRGPPWFNTAGSPAAAAAVQLLSEDALRTTFLSGHTHLTQTMGKDSRGRSAIRLTDASGSIFLATASPHNILEITTAAHYLLGSFSAVDIYFDAFDAPVTVAIPAHVVTPDLVHMPPYFFIVSVDSKSCTSSGCALTAVVGSEAGSGTATVTITVTDAAAGKLASCVTTVVVATYSATPTASCHAHGSAWANWWNNIGGTYYFHASVLHPAYNS